MATLSVLLLKLTLEAFHRKGYRGILHSFACISAQGLSGAVRHKPLTTSSQNERIDSALNRFQSLSWIAAEKMHLISIRNLRQDSSRYPHLKKVIDEWYSILRKAQWQSLEDVRRIFRDAEAVGNFTVFNIKGNEYRLIVGIDYENQVVYYKYLLTHAEYDKDRWKNDPYF